MKIRFASVFMLAVLASTIVPATAGEPLPLTNADVVKMVQGHLASATIVTAITTEKHDFDLSSNGLISLKRAGVPEDVIRAMLGANAAPAQAHAEAATVSVDGQAIVSLLDGSAQRPMQSTVAQAIAQQGKGLPIDVTSTVMQTAAAESMSLMHGPLTGLAAGLVGSFFSMFSPRSSVPQVHAQWAVANASAGTVLANGTPAFDVRYQGTDTNALEAAIVRLVPTTDNARIVRVDMVVPTHVESLAPGHVRLSTESPLARGEYAVIVSHVPNTVWDFSIH